MSSVKIETFNLEKQNDVLFFQGRLHRTTMAPTIPPPWLWPPTWWEWNHLLRHSSTYRWVQ